MIEEYIKRLTKEDVDNFAIKNGIQLSEEEINIIFKFIKEDWKTIMYGNPRGILDSLKEQININSYNKIEQLYIQFKNRYL